MPIPKPRKGETESGFMERCMGSDTMRSEYPQRDQRVAVCLSSFRDKQKGTEMSDATVEELSDDLEEKVLDIAFDLKAYGDDEDDEDRGKFSGYGSIFGNKDLGNDVIMSGAFSKSIARKGPRGIKMLYQHKTDEPIGVFEEIIEDNKGLKVKGRLAMGTQRGREVYELMKMGAIDGLSIGYRVATKGSRYEDNGKKRIIEEVELMEISAVTFPMNPRAKIQAVKGAEKTVREWEECLRDAGSLSRSEAKVAASAVHKALNESQRDVGEEQRKAVIEKMAKLKNLMT
mgnify:CR=1 FL=1|tara:strand:- start:541 stop:1401 length:861 start_codon:yes stop_codon:yes gene_type:complete